MPDSGSLAVELAAQAEDARLPAGHEESGEETKHNQHPNVHREAGHDGADRGQGESVSEGGGPPPGVRQETHGVGAEHHAQEARGGQDALLVEGRLEVALHLVHDQTDAHDLHHDGHEAEPADQEQLVVEAAHAGQRDGLLEAVG